MCESKGISGLDSHLCEKEALLCLIDVLCTAAAKQQTPETELASIRFVFFEMIVHNALEDERDGLTLCFADEPIGNHQSIRRSTHFTLDERILLVGHHFSWARKADNAKVDGRQSWDVRLPNNLSKRP